jgi:hypothetical protein
MKNLFKSQIYSLKNYFYPKKLENVIIRTISNRTNNLKNLFENA